MTEETDRLKMHDRARDLVELTSAKVRLTGLLETEIARLNREQPGWSKAMEEDQRARLTAVVSALGTASTENAAVIERHLELSNELMKVIAKEARRQFKKRADTYSDVGTLSPIDLSPPISVNSQF
nr:flagellar biosynthesis protein FlgN [Sphingomonas quercus]